MPLGTTVTGLGHPSSLLPGPPRVPRAVESGPRDSLSKVMELPALEKRIARHRAQGERIVHCQGCFDLVHPGHLRYLQFARTQGEILVVSLTSDDVTSRSTSRGFPSHRWIRSSTFTPCASRAFATTSSDSARLRRSELRHESRAGAAHHRARRSAGRTPRARPRNPRRRARVLLVRARRARARQVRARAAVRGSG